MGIKFIFHVFCIIWGAPACNHVAKIAQGLKGKVLRMKFVLPIESWYFTFFHFSFVFSWFCIMSSSMWLLQFECEVFDLFQEFYKVHKVEVLSQDPRQQKEFWLTNNYKCRVEVWAICAQLDLKVVCKRPKKKRRPSNFYEFWSKQVHSKKHPIKINL
jgi:hypothetical protein